MRARAALRMAALGGAVLAARADAARAAEIKVWTARALATVLAEVGPRFENATGHRLARETEILQLIAKGISNSEAAKLLNLSKATIRTHLEHIYRKLEVTNRVEAVTEGLRKGLIQV